MTSMQVEVDSEQSALLQFDNVQATAAKTTECDTEVKDDFQSQQNPAFGSDETSHQETDSTHLSSNKDKQLPSLSQLSLNERLDAAIKLNSKNLFREGKEVPTRETALSPISFHVNTGKNYMVPWQICETWDRMKSFLQDIFVGDDKALSEFEQGQYELVGQLQEYWPATVIIPDVWEDVIKPGFVINLRMPPFDKSVPNFNAEPGVLPYFDPELGVPPNHESFNDTQEGKSITYSISYYQTDKYHHVNSLLFTTHLDNPAEFAEHKRTKRPVLEEQKVIQCAIDSEKPTKNQGHTHFLRPDDTVASISLRVHSPFLLNVLRAVVQFTSYPLPQGLPMSPMPPNHMGEDGDNYGRGTFQYPYKDFFCHKEDILRYKIDPEGLRAAHSDEYNEQCDRHIDILMEYLDAQTIIPYNDFKLQWMKSTPTTSFAAIWLLLRPGKDAYIKQEGQLNGFVVDRLEGGVSYELGVNGVVKVSSYIVHAWNMVFDGRTFGRRSKQVTIPYFDGERDITSLPVFPANIQDDIDGGSTRKRLVERGQKYFRYSQGPTFLEYSGPGLKPGWKMYKRARVVVEHASRPWEKGEFVNTAWNMTHQDSQKPQTPYLPPPIPQTSLGANLRVPQCECPQCAKSRAVDGIYTITRFSDYDGLDPKETDSLTEHQCYLLTSHMYGFILKDRAYDILDIEGLEEPSIVKNAIDRLVMDPMDKETIKAIAKTYTENDQGTEFFSADFINGKGEGQILLLHGPPGTGKTLTAESVAEFTKRPLLSITAADLGDKPEQLERNLLNFFRNAHDWDAIVLLDEADIYLEARSAENLRRNSIVSVFLRALDYFQGILFLTTNRVGHFDEAFMSRIHVSIGYDRLTNSARAQIWGNLFNKLKEDSKRGGVKVEYDYDAKNYVTKSEDILRLEWNGREIRNAFQTAVALAVSESKEINEKKEMGEEDIVPEVKEKHLAQVVKLSSAFKRYMKSTHGNMGDSDYAYAHGNRDDEYDTRRRIRREQRGSQLRDV